MGWILVWWTVLAGCGSPPATQDQVVPPPGVEPVAVVAKERRWSFEGVPLPTDDGSARAPRTSPGARLDGGKRHRLGYNVLFRPGDRVGDAEFGRLFDASGAPLEGEEGLCNDVDYTSLLQAHGQLWMVSHFECTPSALYLSRLQQDPQTGALKAVSTRPVDESNVGGGWIHCAGQVTPWGTHLSSEEYEPDAKLLAEDGTLADKYGAYAAQLRYVADPKQTHPYRFGWIPELAIINAEGGTSVVKHYSMGRFSHELAYVLPDERTTYLSDDGYNTGFFMYVADRPGDLSEGTLYASRWTMAEGLLGRLGWVSLGHASDAEISKLIERRVGFEQIFLSAEPVGEGACAEGFTSIHTSNGHECLQLAPASRAVPDPALAASRLETRRYAAMLGATTEVLKGEGLAHDPKKDRLYVAISVVGYGMKGASEQDIGGPDHIRLEENRCGVVAEGDGQRGVVDTDGAPIPSDHVVTSLKQTLAGRWLGGDGPDRCDTEGMSNPDNLAFGNGTLFIAEDSRAHAFNVLWAFDPESGGLTRIQTAPKGGEVAGIGWYANLGGWSYLTSNFQHPLGRLPEGDTVVAGPGEKRAYVGVIGPFPEGG
jgi:uncharacterized protein